MSFRNVSPLFSVQLINRISQLIKDYCGSLSEELVRENFILIYELLDEVIVCVNECNKKYFNFFVGKWVSSKYIYRRFKTFGS